MQQERSSLLRSAHKCYSETSLLSPPGRARAYTAAGAAAGAAVAGVPVAPALAAGAAAVAAEGAAAFDVTTPDWKLMISLYSSKSISPSPLVSAKLMSASI